MDEIYVCMSCGHEDIADKFGRFCPRCGSDLDELDAMFSGDEERHQIDEEEEKKEDES